MNWWIIIGYPVCFIVGIVVCEVWNALAYASYVDDMQRIEQFKKAGGEELKADLMKGHHA